MSQIESLGSDRYSYRDEQSLLARLIGLPFVGFGLWVGVWPILGNLYYWITGQVTTAQVVECIPGVLVGMLIGLPLLGVGWFLTFLRRRLEIDLAERQVTAVNDFLVYSFRKTFALDDIDHIAVEITKRRSKDRTTYYAQVVLATQTDSIIVSSWHADLEQEAHDLARELSELTGITLVDKTGSFKEDA